MAALQQRSEVRDGMRIHWDVEIPMNDGLVLKADVFLPIEGGPFPVIMTYGPYAKGLAFQDGYPSAWQRMIAQHPDAAYGSSNKHQNWEVVDPEKWVPHGYACIRVDSRGTGRSPGYVDHFSLRETKDFHDCIEWAGVQPWSNGKVGLNGVSYYGINQWHVASRQPKHLAAMCVWEGAADWYRDMTHHGGILSTFWANWYDMQVKTVQYGLGERGPRSAVSGLLICGGETLNDHQLAENRCSFRGRDPEPSPRRRLSQGAFAGLEQDHGAVSFGGELGRPGTASTREFRGVRARGIERESGSKSMASNTGRTFTPIMAANCNCAFSTIFFTARKRSGRSSRRCCYRFVIRRKIRRAGGKRMAAQAYQVDQVLSRSPRAWR